MNWRRKVDLFVNALFRPRTPVRSVDIVPVIADALVLTDALTPNDAETLHPDHYVVDAEDVEHLVRTVLTLREGVLG